jgi:hypothetical protein
MVKRRKRRAPARLLVLSPFSTSESAVKTLCGFCAFFAAKKISGGLRHPAFIAFRRGRLRIKPYGRSVWPIK